VPPRIAEVYPRGVLTLARLGREAPIAAASPSGPALRNAAYGSSASAQLYPESRQGRPAAMPKSPVVGTDSPVQYQLDPSAWTGGGGSEPEAASPAPPTAPGAQPTTAAQVPDDPQKTKISWKRP
jgi:hypothetical protein